MAAAIELKTLKPALRVVILEKNSALGRKIRATGNGRCNITNTEAYGYVEIMKWLTEIGVVTRTYENGLVYPYSESAADVTELLIDRVNEAGIEVITEASVSRVEQSGEGFTVEFAHKDADGTPLDESLTAGNVILALGGKAGPNYGTTGDGYAIARALGHTVVTPIPVLTPVECADWDASLGGIRARGIVSLYRDETEAFPENSKIFEEAGEIQFTKTGLSGIAVFNMTGFMRYNRADGENLSQFRIRLNLFADGNISEHTSLRTILKPELAAYVEAKGIESIHALDFTPTAIKGWKDAQATSGGVSLDEIDPETCESLLVPGLYVTGELLDYDGPCGGFNLSNAWLTGLKAAHALQN